MSRLAIKPTGVERFFEENEIIVSKTDLAGRVTYANEVFLKIAGYTEEEILGAPHSIIRHPDMPRAVFQVLWDTIEAGKEIFAYVINMAKNGDHYWVLAHVTPTFGPDGKIVGYHSNRRVPDRNAVTVAADLYAQLRAVENEHPDRREGLAASLALLGQALADTGMPYEEFVWTLAA
ncbi:MAG: PAS domain-containing protein [Candidatus Eisenbacteria bacterium]|uniref:PAS domain-containing protein n=1 Tax=Eiseniibacteriota bacterium TaxID=2212470 RepID=A0A956M2I9_UNCEI|nr:PAS domain-containing protein [Candidatus Eisenbacteria bacterium]